MNYKKSIFVHLCALLPLTYCLLVGISEESTIKLPANLLKNKVSVSPLFKVGDNVSAIKKSRGYRIDRASSSTSGTLFLSNFLWRNGYQIVVNCDNRKVQMVQLVQLFQGPLCQLNEIYREVLPAGRKAATEIDDLEVKQGWPNPAIYYRFENDVWSEVIYSEKHPNLVQQVTLYKE